MPPASRSVSPLSSAAAALLCCGPLQYLQIDVVVRRRLGCRFIRVALVCPGQLYSVARILPYVFAQALHLRTFLLVCGRVMYSQRCSQRPRSCASCCRACVCSLPAQDVEHFEQIVLALVHQYQVVAPFSIPDVWWGRLWDISKLYPWLRAHEQRSEHALGACKPLRSSKRASQVVDSIRGKPASSF